MAHAKKDLPKLAVSIEPLGMVFIRLITMTVVPLVIGSLFVACASLGSVRRLAGRGLRFSTRLSRRCPGRGPNSRNTRRA